MKLKIVIIILIAVMLISGCFLAWSLGTRNPSPNSTESINSFEQMEWFTHSIGHSDKTAHPRTVIEK
ncbi:hypothetical protein [Pseudoramibacter porci]|uniref:Uncharacterized protein n=1 Tax=Pseudoramibacter porci TaxID=2606631 RepID=A0A7X2NG52_9FIRM|nr:hypothetical protein [Pseudoramibacter porci]MSS19996.1 hypothetical protein [Pseudoramibacter porci]